MLFFLNMNVAEAGIYKKKDFFDFGYAQEIWNTIKTEEEFDAAWERIDIPYSAWKERRSKNETAAMEELKTHPKATLIKQGHDLEATYYQWLNGYKNYLRSGPIPWNHEGYGFYCGAMTMINIFTNSCTDFPDWRTSEGKARDEANVAKNFAAFKAKKDYILGNSN